MTNPLAYDDNTSKMPEGYKFKISPSQFATFIDYPFNWFRTQVLKEVQFTHNTSSVIGTIVHYCAEMVATKQQVDMKAIEEYIDSWEVNENYDPRDVRAHWQEMAERLVNDYVLNREFLLLEEFAYAEVKDGYFIGGKLDAGEGTKEDLLITDYKTYSSKTKPKAIPAYYRYQLLTLAALWTRKGYNVTRIRLVYVNRHIEGDISEKTGKQLKSYPSEVTVLTETLVPADMEFINSLLELCVDSCEATIKHPELTHVIWHDNRLKITN